MAFREIIGQEKAISILKGCIMKNRIPHAMLFAGDEGIGKRLTALNFAKALNCRGTGGGDLFSAGTKEGGAAADAGDIDACDRCPSCTKTDRASHPDVFIIRPEGDGGQITVSAIRQLEESLSYKPFEGRWKVAIIDNADRLNQSASNAFLQTLEEPAPRSILILITSRPDVMLATIRSRCQRINFTPLPVDLMQELLKERLEKSDSDKSTLLSVLSGGRLGHALDENLIAQRDRSFEIFRRMLGRVEEDAWDDRDEIEMV
ncbi:MAG: DNA polymerase III subunit delta' [Deferribacteres bacterium]|nr:DNA polymerase III subunit delta' [Deferribacteres bacterium]